jgi:RNA polymerase sigma-70 factor, ECF subfamily
MPDDGQGADEALVARAQGGDRGALEALVRRHQRPVFRLCLRYLRDQDEAADLVQRTFLRAMTSLGELRSAERFRTWILRIGANLALNHLRDHARFVGDDAATEQAAAAPLAPDGLEAGEAARALRRAVEALPTKQRMTLELRVYEELSFREIALALATTEGAAKVNFHYAVRKLRALLGPAADAPPAGKGSGQGKGKELPR